MVGDVSRQGLCGDGSGAGVEGNTLTQNRRFFHRINGVENVITSKGDVVVSTTFANSTIVPGQAPVEGRFSRSFNPDIGGSIRIYVKPSQSLELDFNEQINGIGVRDSVDAELPQINPSETTSQPASDVPNTRVTIDQEFFRSRVPIDHEFVCGESFTVTTGESTTFDVGEECIFRVEGTVDIISSDVVTLDGTQILLGANAASPEAVIKGDSLRQWFTTTFTVDSPFGPLPATLTGVNLLLAETGSTKSFVE